MTLLRSFAMLTLMNRKSLYVGSLAIALTLLSSFALLPAANAYGKPNWQTTFSGNCDNVVHCFGAHGGFWGWCAFGGGTAVSGNNADCQSEQYTHSKLCATTLFCIDAHTSISGTAWDIEPSAFSGANDFFITDGVERLSGPTIVQAIASGTFNSFPQPPCVISGQSITCPLSVFEAVGIYFPDTGITAIPGHTSSTLCSDGTSAPGCHYNQQVTQIP
jgi:hypothetical protein